VNFRKKSIDRYKNFLIKLRQARKDTNLSQEEVAKLLGKSQSFVSRSENGERRVDVIELQEFAKIYNKQISFFLDI